MAFFGLVSDVPALTASAQTVSAVIGQLDDAGQQRAVHTVRSLVGGIRGLGSLPEAVNKELWSMLMTIVRKAATRATPEEMFAEIEAGLSPQLRGMIEKEARS